MAHLWMEKNHIIFDWNGTLLDDVDLAVEAVCLCCRRFGIKEIDRDTYRQRFRFPIQDFYAGIGFDFAEIRFEDVVKSYLGTFDRRVGNCRLHYGARSLLDEMRRKGKKVSILSASHRDILAETLHKKRLTHYFEHAVGLQNRHAVSKLKLAMALKKTLGIPGSQVLYVGDTQHDSEVAMAAGWTAQLVSCGHQNSKILATHTPNVLPGLRALALSQLDRPRSAYV